MWCFNHFVITCSSWAVEDLYWASRCPQFLRPWHGPRPFSLSYFSSMERSNYSCRYNEKIMMSGRVASNHTEYVYKQPKKNTVALESRTAWNSSTSFKAAVTWNQLIERGGNHQGKICLISKNTTYCNPPCCIPNIVQGIKGYPPSVSWRAIQFRTEDHKYQCKGRRNCLHIIRSNNGCFHPLVNQLPMCSSYRISLTHKLQGSSIA